MIGRTLGFYFYFQFLRSIGVLMTGIVALILLIDFTILVERTSGLATFSFADTLRLSLYRTPGFAEETLPFAALFTSIATLVSLNRKHELVIVRSVGISVWQFMMPIAAAALTVGILAVTIFNPLSTAGFARAQLLESVIFQQAAGPSTDSIVPWLRQRSGENEMIIGANVSANGGLLLSGVTMVFFQDDGSVRDRIEASRAVLEDGHWAVEDATRFVAGQPPEPIGNVEIPTNLQPEFVQERLTAPESISFWDLPSKIDVSRALGLSSAQFSTQFQILLARPALLVAMAVIAATVSLQFVRFGQAGVVILGGILAGFVLYVVTVLVRTFGASGDIPPIVAAWLPVLVALSLGVTILLHKEDG